MSAFSTWARSLAKKADYKSVSHALLNTDGAQLETHSTEKQLLMLENILSKPLTHEDLVSTISICSFPVLRYAQRAFRDLVEHDEAIDDRKLLVSCCFVASTPSSNDFCLSLVGDHIDQIGALQRLLLVLENTTIRDQSSCVPSCLPNERS